MEQHGQEFCFIVKEQTRLILLLELSVNVFHVFSTLFQCYTFSVSRTHWGKVQQKYFILFYFCYS
jgi:hypothetical protein